MAGGATAVVATSAQARAARAIRDLLRPPLSFLLCMVFGSLLIVAIA
jgi:hypothetical protein